MYQWGNAVALSGLTAESLAIGSSAPDSSGNPAKGRVLLEKATGLDEELKYRNKGAGGRSWNG